jgi:hypothetical protein
MSIQKTDATNSQYNQNDFFHEKDDDEVSTYCRMSIKETHQ